MGLSLAFSFLVSWLPLLGQTANDFGNKDWVNDGLAGKIYALPESTQQLPDFDTMTPLGTIYTKKIDVPNHSWTEGFPGVTDRFEWFGIEYKSTFKVKKEGHYTFQLYSDDGSKLFIDDSLVIDNDGLHSQRERSGEIDLDNSTHKIRLQYYQGPRTEIGLQLYVTFSSEKQEVFPGSNFTLYTPGKRSVSAGLQNYIVWLAGLLLLMLIIVLRKRYWRKQHPLKISYSHFDK